MQKQCALRSSGETHRHLKHGDVILGGISQLTYGYYFGDHDWTSPPEDRTCSRPLAQYLRHYLAFDFAIEEINKNPNLLPNITLGYDMYDSCVFPEQAVQATMRALSGGVKHHWNYRCGNNGKVIAFIGHLLSTPSQSIAQMLNLYGHPQERSSSCAETCTPGYSRELNQRIYCCYLCVLCAAGKYSSGIDSNRFSSRICIWLRPSSHQF
ncbi:extracellular calcium-sensing receptor-like [Dendropsophus ebraccatus]|uniref:extracellular calcium-sensing receptor-like n=1 Tax=Dendropsophus ebraccatus TaxID=150705 RepID=UPI003831B08F